MKRQILFLQGGGAGAYKEDEQLVARLRHALGTAYELRYPKMPTENNPDYKKWKARIGKELSVLKGDMILIGHSLGGSFLLKYVSEERFEKNVAGIFLLATPYWGGNGWRYEGYEEVSLAENFASKLPSGASIFLYHSRDDEVVPFEHLTLYAKKMPQATIRALDKGGHQFNNDLPEVVADIKRLLNL
jgi:predicted alpha/beta hydrolase family esterase